jgi:hypothetical protein
MTDAEVKARIIQLRKQRERAQKVIETNLEAEEILEASRHKEAEFKTLFSRMDLLHEKMDMILRETTVERTVQRRTG